MANPSNVTQVVIVPMEDLDQDRVLEIYRQGIATGNATFETQLPD